MFCNIYFFVLLTLVISETSAQLRPQMRDNVNGEDGDEGNARRRLESAFLCSEAGNCTCLFEKFQVTVKCNSAGEKLDVIAPELPKATTHL